MTGFMTLAVSVTALAQGQFSIKGTIPGMADSIRVALVDMEDPNEEYETYAKVNPKSGSFELTADLKAPHMTRLCFQRYSRRADGYLTSFSTRVLAAPGSHLLETGACFDSLCNMREPESAMKVSGSAYADQLNEFLSAVRAKELHARDMGYLSASKYFESDADPDTVAKYKAISGKADRELLAEKMRFVAEHPAYNVSAYEVQRQLERIFTYTEQEIDAMADMVKACPDTARVNTVNRRRDFLKHYALGMKCPEFDATTPEGESKAFSSLLEPGKYTFIDFWASWCGPCRAAIPHVRELAERYAGDMNVFSVSVDENEQAWRKAMEKEGMTWRQFHLAKGEQMDKGARAFFITTIPRLVLIDGEGRVVCSTNDPDDVKSMLEDRFGK